MQGKCGLVKSAGARKRLVKLGYVDPHNFLFAREHIVEVREVAGKRAERLDTVYDAYAELHRSYPFQESPDFARSVRALIEQTQFQSDL
jgi:hypothetical protein